MAGELTRRKELHDFLKAARSRVQPKDLGITPPGNRRGSGLQQADLAAALNVSPRWYNGFENGAVAADDGMLDRVAQILRLTPAERVHLYLLAAGHQPSPGTVAPPHGAEAALTRLVRQIGDLAIPAVVTDIAWSVLAWNRALATWFPDPGAGPSHARNAVLWAFTSEIETIVEDVARFREAHIGWAHLAVASHPGDPRLASLIDRLQRIPQARHLWGTQQITQLTDAITPVRFRVAGSAGPVEADLVSTEFPGGYRLMMLIPHSRWPSPPAAAAFSRLIRRRSNKPAGNDRQGM